MCHPLVTCSISAPPPGVMAEGGGGWQRGPARLSSRSCEEITRMQKAWGPDLALLPGRPSSICTV